MKRLWMGCLGLVLVLVAERLHAQDVQWRPVEAPASSRPNLGVTLRTPEPWPTAAAPKKADADRTATTDAGLFKSDFGALRLVRAQIPDPVPAPDSFAQVPAPLVPPPPPPPPPGLPASLPPAESYNNAVKANSSSGTGFWDQTRDTVTGIPSQIGIWVAGDSGRAPFQSDHCFDYLCSPVTNPFYFEDPRSLTEIKPLVIYDHVPDSNYAFHGGSIWFYGFQGGVAFTDTFSLVINKLGAVTINPGTTEHGVSSDTGFAEFSFGPKFTFLRLDSSKTVLAAGLNFDCAIGNRTVFQDTGSLSLVPYFSVAQNFLPTPYGSFNVMSTTGYSFATDNIRTDFLYTSAHLDFDVANLNKIFPLIEMNYFHYTTNGHSPEFYGFEGRDLINFGSGGVAGMNDLSLAVGARYKFAEWCQVGAAIEFPLLTHNDLYNFRLGFDVIFRY